MSEPSLEPKAAPRRGRVLIVDDDLKIRVLLRAVFERLGLEADEAYDGRDALDMIIRNDYDLVLLDLMMPELDGAEVLTRVPHPRPHFLLFTGADSEDVERINPALYCEWISKPFDLEPFLRLVNHCLADHSTGSPPTTRVS